MTVDNTYQQLFNQGMPSYYGITPGGVTTQTYGPSPVSAWGGKPIDLAGGNNYPSLSQSDPNISQHSIFPSPEPTPSLEPRISPKPTPKPEPEPPPETEPKPEPEPPRPPVSPEQAKKHINDVSDGMKKLDAITGGKGDGKVSFGDIDKAIADRKITGEGATYWKGVSQAMKDGKIGANGLVDLKGIVDHDAQAGVTGDKAIDYVKLGGGVLANTKQQDKGDCFFLSGVRALSETEKGREYIKNAIKSNSDGSYDVKFKGSDKSYHVNKQDAEKQGEWANGDQTMQILGSAADQYFKEHGQKNGIAAGGDPRSIFELFGGKEGTKTEIEASRSGGGPTKDDIKKFLGDNAAGLSKNTALTLIGSVDEKGNWAPGDPAGGHVFQVTNIDKTAGTVTYTNPWDTSQKRTIKIDDLAAQMTKDGKDNGALVGRTYS